MNERMHPVEVLDERMETLRFRLIDYFGGPDSVPTSLKAAYLGVALCAAELAGAHQAQAMVTPSMRVRV